MDPLETTDPDAALKHIRVNRESFRALRRIVLGPERATVFDINNDAFQIDGIGWKTEGVRRFLQGLGASFDPTQVDVPPISGDSKEFKVVKSDPWGHDRIL